MKYKDEVQTIAIIAGLSALVGFFMKAMVMIALYMATIANQMCCLIAVIVFTVWLGVVIVNSYNKEKYVRRIRK